MSASKENGSVSKEVKDLLKAFIDHNPSANYTFDSERGSSESEICRKGALPGQGCITLQMDSKSLFSAMQDLGFFCALPIDPQRTHMECKPMYKSQ